MSGRGHLSHHETPKDRQDGNRACGRRFADRSSHGHFRARRTPGIPSVPFAVFEWLIRVLPGRLVMFGLDLTVRILQGLGFNIKNTAKTAEQVLLSRCSSWRA